MTEPGKISRDDKLSFLTFQSSPELSHAFSALTLFLPFLLLFLPCFISTCLSLSPCTHTPPHLQSVLLFSPVKGLLCARHCATYQSITNKMCSLPSVISKFYRKKGQTNQYIDGCYNRCVCVWNIVGGERGVVIFT